MTVGLLQGSISFVIRVSPGPKTEPGIPTPSPTPSPGPAPAPEQPAPDMTTAAADDLESLTRRILRLRGLYSPDELRQQVRALTERWPDYQALPKRAKTALMSILVGFLDDEEREPGQVVPFPQVAVPEEIDHDVEATQIHAHAAPGESAERVQPRLGQIVSFDSEWATGQVKVGDHTLPFGPADFDSGMPQRAPIPGDRVRVLLRPGTTVLLGIRQLSGSSGGPDHGGDNS